MTHVPGRLVGVVLAFAAIAAPAAAQDDPRFALVTSFPSPTVSFQWDMSERVALRIEGSYSFRDESTSRTTAFLTDVSRGISLRTETQTEATSHTSSIGFAGILTIHRSDQLRLYLAPRVLVAFSRDRISETTIVPPVPPGFLFLVADSPGTETFEDSSTSLGAGVSFGAASNVHRRLALFGEAGFTWGRSDGPLFVIPSIASSLASSDSKRTTINTRAVGGVMLLF